MHRRAFLKGAGAGFGVAASTFVPGAFADGPAIKWRLASSYPKSLDTIYGAAELLAERLRGITGGKFQIRVFAGGDLVPGLQVMDAVQNGTVECGHTASYYYVGKNMAFAFDCAVPFGLTARQQNAWMYFGGGIKLMRELFRQYNIVQFPGGNTGVQMGGWFRKEIKSLADLKGLKMRIPGIGGQIMAKLGAVPQTLAGQRHLPLPGTGRPGRGGMGWALRRREAGLPQDRQALLLPGLVGRRSPAFLLREPGQVERVARCLPGRLRGRLRRSQRQHAGGIRLQESPGLDAPDETGRPVARLPEGHHGGRQEGAFAMYDEEAARNAAFARIYGEWKKFRDTEIQWFKVAEASYANFLYYSK
jgi:TRAP-type mannitol/chloroaromatic compound transport system substrate-binding protein